MAKPAATAPIRATHRPARTGRRDAAAASMRGHRSTGSRQLCPARRTSLSLASAANSLRHAAQSARCAATACRRSASSSPSWYAAKCCFTSVQVIPARFLCPLDNARAGRIPFHSPLFSNAARSRLSSALPRASRDITVPTGSSRISAMRAYDSCSTSRRTMQARYAGDSVASNASARATSSCSSSRLAADSPADEPLPVRCTAAAPSATVRLRRCLILFRQQCIETR